jgi:hypothetical protein
MTDYMKEAEAIHNEYQRRSIHIPFQDAVISFLYLFARWLLAAEKKPTKK